MLQKLLQLELIYYNIQKSNTEKIRVAFGPDEEIGRGADLFDVEQFACDFAYTMDGGPVGELEYESFNACRATVRIQGKNVHPGTAKDTMVSALELARKFQNALPEFEVPEHTTGREGFYHLVAAEGVVEEAKLVYILRDHSRELFNAKKDMMLRIATRMNKELDTDVLLWIYTTSTTTWLKSLKKISVVWM